MTIFYIPNPTQYLNLTTLLTVNKQQKKAAKSLVRQNMYYHVYCMLPSCNDGNTLVLFSFLVTFYIIIFS